MPLWLAIAALILLIVFGLAGGGGVIAVINIVAALIILAVVAVLYFWLIHPFVLMGLEARHQAILRREQRERIAKTEQQLRDTETQLKQKLGE